MIRIMILQQSFGFMMINPVTRYSRKIYITSNANMRAAQLILVLATCFVVIKGQCLVTIDDDLPSPQPLVLRPGLGGGFRNPDDTLGTLRFAAGENVRLVCTGMNNKFVNLTGTQSDVLATCVRKKTFSVSGVSLAFGDLACSFLPSHNQRRSGKTCLGQYTDVDLGFDLGNEFLTIINSCHDEDGAETLYSKFTLVKEISGFQPGFRRPGWVQGIFWPGFKLPIQYNQKTQIATIGTVLGSTELGQQYIHGSNHFFSRGHLAAKSDFVYGAQHGVTFYYVNSAPQWQVFNAGNWYALEKDIRDFASGRYQDLTVYAGVHGIAQLPNVYRMPTDLYFYADSNGNRAIPIPKFFWKVIYNEKTQLGTAFVGVNNPYLTSVTSDYYLCPNISSQISWLTWQPNNVASGISYACTVDSLRSVVSNIPSFTVRGVLV